MTRHVPRRLAALAIALLALPSIAVAAELPKRKSGLWEVSTDAGEGKTVAAQMCVDQKTDDLSRQIAGAGVTCSKQTMRREGQRFIHDSVCKFGDSTATSRAVFSGSFESSYEVDVSARYSPPIMGMSEGRSIIKARWIGPCKPGQKPGDVIMPNGTVINLQNPPKPPSK